MTPLELLSMLFLMVSGGHGAGATPQTDVTTPSKPTTTTKPTTPSKPTAKPAKPAAKKTSVILPASTEAPKPWPAVKPPDLPKYPDGWEPYIPPPPSVVSRAAQLLPEMWKQNKPGVTKVEQTDGVWVTYVTFVPSKGKKGVAAYRLKEGGAAAPSSGLVPASTKSKAKPTKKGTIKA